MTVNAPDFPDGETHRDHRPGCRGCHRFECRCRGLANTSVFIDHESGRPLDVEALPDELAVSIITIGELRAGVLAASTLDLRDRRLAALTAALLRQRSGGPCKTAF